MSLKIEFVERAKAKGSSMSELCREFGITRQTGYKWLNRFNREGPDGLEEASRRPRSSPLATAEDLVVAVLRTREAHPRWGARKIRQFMLRSFREATPGQRTIARILTRSGLIRDRRSVRRLSIIEKAPTVSATAPNEVWTTDFKGWWRTKDGSRCDPLTVRDAYSRFMLDVRVMESGPRLAETKDVFERLFRKHGLPRSIQCDNGTPFICTRSRGGLTRLSAWWISLGIRVLRSRPGCPQDNGGHERMHRDLSEEVEAFPTDSPESAQRACDRWRQEFNYVRPHEALNGKSPGDLYRGSECRRTRPLRYAYHPEWLIRAVAQSGSISIGNSKVTASQALAGHFVALQRLGGLRYRLWFYDLDLGELEVAPQETIDDAVFKFAKRPVAKQKRSAQA